MNVVRSAGLETGATQSTAKSAQRQNRFLIPVPCRSDVFLEELGRGVRDDAFADEHAVLGGGFAAGGDGGLHAGDVACHDDEAFAAKGHGEMDFKKRDVGGFDGGVGDI